MLVFRFLGDLLGQEKLEVWVILSLGLNVLFYLGMTCLRTLSMSLRGIVGLVNLKETKMVS